LQPGDWIDDRFEIERFAAAGGMGELYRAIDHATGRHVAVKVLRGVEPCAVQRFAREARCLAALSHPGIVAHLGDGRTARGEQWLAMDWLEGEDLATRLAHGRLGVRETLGVGAQLAAALGAAHARGIVHRDVKPSNVFLVGWRAADVRLLDFGVARLAGLAPLTAAGFFVGTPLYMAPEQAGAAGVVDARADVFALGAVMFRCLTGSVPFPAGTAVEMIGRLISDLPAPRVATLARGVPAPVAALVDRMLAKDPAARPRDGAAVAAELAAWAPEARYDAAWPTAC
jgi:serine/threonine protein kinase